MHVKAYCFSENNNSNRQQAGKKKQKSYPAKLQQLKAIAAACVVHTWPSHIALHRRL